MSWIYNSLTESIMARVVGLKSAYDIWTTLGINFASANNARLLDLEQSLQDISKAGSSVQDYVVKLKDLTDSLAALGEPVPENKQVRYFLRGLGSEYNAFVTSVANQTRSAIS